MPDTTATDLSSLGRDLEGDVYLPGDEGWDDARRAWNLAVDLQPAAVVQAANAADVARVVDFARERGLRVAAQSTGHGAGGMAPLTDTILLRTGRLDGIEIDAAGRRARVESGVLAADVAWPPARPAWPRCSARPRTPAWPASRSAAGSAGSAAATGSPATACARSRS